eukprot:15360745-Ditylum_brightwellii.AAC.1
MQTTPGQRHAPTVNRPVIGGAVSVYLLEFTSQGEIGHTKSRSSIQHHFNTFNNANTVSQESAIVLQALSFCTKDCVMFGKNLYCKEVQKMILGLMIGGKIPFMQSNQHCAMSLCQVMRHPKLQEQPENSAVGRDLLRLGLKNLATGIRAWK